MRTLRRRRRLGVACEGAELPRRTPGARVVDYGASLIIPRFVDANVHPCHLPNIGSATTWSFCRG
jgi:cytosine/adenosine deaminase-related metal-dependent hydrolase